MAGHDPMKQRAGFVGTRFAGTDGVSLETAKWAHAFKKLGIEAVYFSGRSDRPAEVSYATEVAFFEHPEIVTLQKQCFGTCQRSPAVTEQIRYIAQRLKADLYHFLDAMAPDFLVTENALAIPMNIPLGLALTEVIAETGIPTIAHHHDFAWERDRFRVSAVDDLLNAAFPPRLPSILHVVINKEAQRQLAYRCGLSSTVVPNVFNFSKTAPQLDPYNGDLREALEIAPEELIILQPTRIIARKGIEHALELAARIRLPGRKIVFIVPHHELDEGHAYAERISDYARLIDVRMIVQPERIGLERGTTAAGEKRYSLWDLYVHADLVTFPSLYEGFGNAFLEAVYFGKPVFINNYAVFREDIAPLGFRVVTMDSYVTDREVREVERILQDPQERERWAQENLRIAERHFSYTQLESLLSESIAKLGHSLK